MWFFFFFFFKKMVIIVKVVLICVVFVFFYTWFVDVWLEDVVALCKHSFCFLFLRIVPIFCDLEDRVYFIHVSCHGKKKDGYVSFFVCVLLFQTYEIVSSFLSAGIFCSSSLFADHHIHF